MKQERVLYISDLDGTLLNPQAKLSAFTRETINRLVQDGMQFTYATARSHSTASRVLSGLHCSAPAVTHNGSFLTDPQTGLIFDIAYFSEEEAAFARKVFRQYGLSPVVYAVFGSLHLPGFIPEKLSLLSGKLPLATEHFLEDHAGDTRVRFVADEDTLYDGCPFYFNVMINDRAQLEQAAALLTEERGFYITLQEEIYRPGDYWLEVMPVNATKAKGIERLRKRGGYDRVVCFGDRQNDRTMFAACDEAYAPENADEELKAMASGVIGSNAEDGVARFLQKVWEQSQI